MRMVESGPGRTQGFSIVELLTVIAVIAIVVAISVPAVSGARDAARRSATEGLLNNLANAVETFRADNQGRMPGVFTPRELGLMSNGGSGTPSVGERDIAGLTTMENMLLDLAGVGSAVLTAQEHADLMATSPNEAQAYIPRSISTTLDGNEVYVNPGLLGANEAAYLKPQGANFIVQDVVDGSGVRVDSPAAAGEVVRTPFALELANAGQAQVPHIVDAWGQPIIAWAADTGRVTRVRGTDSFAGVSSDSGASLIYWNQNAGVLKSSNFGRLGIDMTGGLGPGAPASLIGVGVAASNAAALPNTLTALLGSPSFPDEPTLTGASVYTAVFPTRPRGSVIFQSAGRDGIPFSSRDPAVGRLTDSGMISLTGGTINLRYGVNFAGSNNARRLGDDGANTQVDFPGSFNDLLTTVN